MKIKLATLDPEGHGTKVLEELEIDMTRTPVLFVDQSLWQIEDLRGCADKPEAGRIVRRRLRACGRPEPGLHLVYLEPNKEATT